MYSMRDGPLQVIRQRLIIRSVWFIDHGTELPRFVTARPCRSEGTSPK